MTIGTTSTTTSGTIETGNTGASPGQLVLMGAGTSGSLTFAAPGAFAGNGSFTWTVPSSAIPSGYPSLLQISPSGVMYYATVTGSTGINVNPAPGSLTFALGPSLNLGSATPVLNDSGGTPILALNSMGASGSNYLKISNDAGGSMPAGPTISSAGPGSTAIPLQISDTAGGGVEIESNGGVALKVSSTTASPSDFVSVNATPSGTFGGDNGVQVAAANALGSGDLALVLKGQNNGPVFIGSNVDGANSAFALEIPADPTGVTAGLLVLVTSSGKALKPTAAARPIAGVALNTTTSGNAVVAYAGKVLCTFDVASPTPGDYVTQAGTGFGRCHDYGATLPPTTVQVLGTVLDSSGNVLLRIGN